MNEQSFRRNLSYFTALCFLLIFALDFFYPQAAAASSALKYMGLLSCVIIAITGGDAALRVALLLTAACDYLLLFTDSYVPGVLAFACVQAVHAARGAKMADISAVKCVLPCMGLAIVAGASVLVMTKNPLYAASAAYGFLLFTAAILAVAAYLRGKAAYRAAVCAAAGMLLFVACDVCVAAMNLGYTAAGRWIWLFYLPSQWLLAQSGREGL